MSKNQSIVDVKTAVNAAYSYLQSMRDLMGGEVRNLRLEEAELSENRDLWLITLGFDLDTFPAMLQREREYKLFKINAETGEVEAMKIREV